MPDARLFVRDTRAAQLLDMSTKEFRRLVEQGALPPAGKFERWDVEQLVDVMRGKAHKPTRGFEL